MEFEKTNEQKEAATIINLYNSYKELKGACQNFIEYMHKKYPGEEIKCPHIKKIDELIKD